MREVQSSDDGGGRYYEAAKTNADLKCHLPISTAIQSNCFFLSPENVQGAIQSVASCAPSESILKMQHSAVQWSSLPAVHT